MDSAEYKAAVAQAEADAAAFEARYRGKLAEIAGLEDGGDKLAVAVKDYEGLEDLLGRIMSYAGLIHAGDTSDPKRAKFFGDAQDKMTTASTKLLFFTLEFNNIEDAVLEKAMKTSSALEHYRPWIEDIRREKPFQLDDKLEQLFFEKSVTGSGALTRLFDETQASLRYTVMGEELPIEATLSLLQDADGEKRKAAAEAMAETFSENLRLFTLITNTLSKDKEISDRWRGFKDVADSRHLANRVEAEVVAALVEAVRDAYPRLSHRYYRLKAKWFGMDALDHWDRNAPLPKAPQRTIGWDEARETVLSAYGDFSPKMAEIADEFFAKRWIDAPVRAGKSPGAFAHPTVPSAHPYVLLNYQGKPRDVMTLAHELGHGVHQVLAGAAGRADGADAADIGGDGERLRRDADLPGAEGFDDEPAAQPGAARFEGRGHDQHGRPPDRLLHFRARGPHRAASGRTDMRSNSARCGWRSRRRASATRCGSARATRRSGATSRISSMRRSTSMPTLSAIAW